MDKLVFLDVETTGIEEEDRLVQIALRAPFLKPEPICEIFKPPVPIAFESMAVHHITEAMVKDKDPFVWSDLHYHLVDIFHDKKAIMVAHNAKFDLAMIKKEGLHPEHTICTMKVQRYLDTEGKMSNYKLQYLRYFYGFEIDAGSHDALDDILPLEALFNKLNESLSVAEMIKITEEPLLMRSIPFGKHKGVPIEKVPRDYMEWLRAQDSLDEDLRYTLNYYLNK